MKNIAKFFFTSMLALFVAASLGATNLPDVVFRKLDGGRKVAVEINNLKTDAVIYLLDQQEQNLLTQEVAQVGNRATRVFNLENLPSGKYFFLVATPQKETVQPVELTSSDILINTNERLVYLVPSIRVGGDYVDVSWFNGKVASLSIKINNLKGETVFEEDVRNVLKLERRYNLAQLERGEYTIVVTTPHKTQYQSLTIR